jgi:hypothetical protein
MLLASLLLAGCQDAGAPEQARAPIEPGSAALAVRDGKGAEGPFELQGLERLNVEVRLAHVEPGAHRLRLDVLAPGSVLYAQLPVSVEVGPDGLGVASQQVQVGGTPIERYRQTGAWTFRLAHAGGAAPLATAQAEIAEAETAE